MSKVKLEHSSLFLFKPSGLFLVDLLNDFDALLAPLDCGCAVCLEDTHKHFLANKNYENYSKFILGWKMCSKNYFNKEVSEGIKSFLD